MANDTDAALVVGINDYQHAALPPLRGAVHDANNFEAWLLDPTGGNVPPTNVVKLTSAGDSSRPRFDEMHNEIGQVVRRAVDASPHAVGRRLYLFLSGHGITTGPFEDCRLLAADASETVPGRAVPGLEVAMAFKHAAAFEEVVLIMDCCREVSFNDIGMPITSLTLLANDRGGTKLCHGLAAKWDRTSGERDLPKLTQGDGQMEPQGVFTHVVLKGLREGADQSGNVTAAGLKRFVEAEMLRLAPAQAPDIDVEPTDFVISSPGSAPLKVRIIVQNPAIGDFEIRRGTWPLETVAASIEQIGSGTFDVMLPRGGYVIGWPPGNPDDYIGSRPLDVGGGQNAIVL